MMHPNLRGLQSSVSLLWSKKIKLLLKEQFFDNGTSHRTFFWLEQELYLAKECDTCHSVTSKILMIFS